MVTGYPDYQRNINIAAQSADQLIERPKYGAPQSILIQGTLAEDEYKTIFSLSGRGIVYGGKFMVFSPFSAKNTALYLSLDDVVVFSHTFAELNTYKITDQFQHYIFLVYYDDGAHFYSVVFTQDITFESNVTLQAKSFSTGTAGYTAIYNYSLI